jgi:hypothetical protein
MGRKYRRRDKRIAYERYRQESKDLSEMLKSGKIRQDEYEKRHELLDEKWSWIR